MDNSLLTVHPTTEANWFNENARTEGMLLRDHFATMAMQALLSSEPFGRFDAAAKDAYLVADAMLRAREAS